MVAFSPNVNSQLLQKYGYNGPVGQGQGDAYLTAHPQYDAAYTADRRAYDNQQRYNFSPQAPQAALNTVTPSGLTQGQNQTAKKQAGYTGGFNDPNEFNQWAVNNPANYFAYTQNARAANPNFKSQVDFDPNAPGVQPVGKSVNQYLGNQVGYYGNTGRGELGSGIQGVDALSTNPDAASYYTKLRQVIDPSYQYTPKNLLPQGFDENTYLQLNPDVADAVARGQYITGGQQYLEQGQGQNRPYQGTQQTNPQDDFLTNLSQMLQGYFNLSSNSTTSSTPTVPTSPPPAMGLPSSLDYLKNLSDVQQRSSIATNALYGLGADRTSRDYYINLLERDMMGSDGKIGDMSNLLPIESNYMSYLGVPTDSGDSFLQGLAKLYGSTG